MLRSIDVNQHKLSHGSGTTFKQFQKKKNINKGDYTHDEK